MKPPRKPSSWFNLWAQERQLLGPSTPRPVPGLDPRLVSEDPLLRQQATREAGQARGREVQEQLRQGGRGEEVASELLLRALNPAYDVAKTLPEAQAMWQAGGFGNRARAVRDMALAALPVVPSLAGTLRRVKGASEAAEGGKTLQSRLWEHLTTQDGFTVNRRGDPMQGNGFLVADPAHTFVIRTDKGAPPPEVQIAQWMRQPEVRAALRRKGAHFGGWYNKKTGLYEINITDVIADRDEAMQLGQRRHQLAVGEIRDGEYHEHTLAAPQGSDLAGSVADDRASRYDPYVKPATNTEDYTIPEPVTTRPITRVENAEGVGPYSGGKTTDQWMDEATDLQAQAEGRTASQAEHDIARERGRRWPLPETQPPPGWRFGFKSPSAMRRWFNEPELTALQHAGFNPREYELLPNSESGLLGMITGRGNQVAFDPERAYPAILGGTDADLYRLEQRRLSEGFAEQDRWADYVARREAGGAEAAAARDTERRLAEFERTRLTPAIDVPEVGQFPGRSHFDATVKFEAAAPPARFPSQRAIDRALRRAREGFASQRRGFLDRRAAMAELTKAQQEIAAPINAELGFNPMELTSEALGEVQRPPEPVAPLAGDEVRATIARMEALLGQPGERFVPRSRGIFDRSVRDPVIEGSSLPAVRGRPNPLVEEIAADPETYRLARMAIERGLPMGGADFYGFGPIRAAFEEAGGPISFNDFVWSGSASSAMQPVPSELSNASILLYAMRHGISVEEAVAEMLARYPKAKRPYMLPVHRSGFEQYLRTGRIDPESPTSGARKIPSYGRGKLGEADVNVLDTHEMSFLGMPSRWRRYLEGKKLTGADYEALDLNRRIARDLGIETRQAQAGRWIGGADVTGVRTPPGDYIQILEDAIYNQAQLLGRGTTPAALRRQFRDIFTEGNDFLLPIYSRRTP